MTESTIASIAGVIFSLAVSYIPGLKEWYAVLSAQTKALVMLAALLLACVVIFASACLGYSTALSCDLPGVKSLVPLFIAAAIANQATYLLTPQTK